VGFSGVLNAVLPQQEFRQASGCFATGVTVITVEFEGKCKAMTANAFASVSLDPPLVLVLRGPSGAHSCAPSCQEAIWAVNVLAEDQQNIFGNSTTHARPKITVIAERDAGGAPLWTGTAHGAPVLTALWLIWSAVAPRHKTRGTTQSLSLEVEEVVVRDGDPLLYYRAQYRKYCRDSESK